MTGEYFLNQFRQLTGGDPGLANEARDQLSEMSVDLAKMYENNPKLFANLLVRMNVFAQIENEEDRIRHNEGMKFLYDMGIIRSDNILSVARSLLEHVKVPQAYLAADDMEV